MVPCEHHGPARDEDGGVPMANARPPTAGWCKDAEKRDARVGRAGALAPRSRKAARPIVPKRDGDHLVGDRL
eukprot:6622184-Alexandrium_andersonii.AAC.1